jgi:hypothetical protein
MSHFISLETGVGMTSLYRSNREAILGTGYTGRDLLPLSESFERDPFDTVLAIDGCVGLRIYYGMGEDLKVHAIIVGYNEAGEDILPEEEDVEELLIERGNRCPDICPGISPLNT